MFDGYNWLIVVFVITANFQFATSNYVRGLGHTKMYALQGIINTALTILFNIIFLVFFDMGVLGYILSVVVANVLVTFFLVFAAKLHRDLDFRFVTKSGLKALLAYSVPMIPTTIFWWVTSVSNHFIVAHFCGGDVNGIFVAAYKIPTVITMMTTVFIEAWHFSAVTDSNEQDRGKFFSSVFKSYMGIIFMAASGLVTFSKVFTILLMSDAFYGAWQSMPLLVVATVFSAFTTFMGSVYLVEKKCILAFLTSMLGGVINVVLSFLLIPLFMQYFDNETAAQGAAVAALVSYFVVFLIRTINAQKYIRFNVQPIRLIINTMLVLVQAIVMMLEIKGWIIVQAVILLLVLAYNGKPILDGIVGVIRKYKNKNGEASE
jgi:O-antigen/teichoic acid export membrane protein